MKNTWAKTPILKQTPPMPLLRATTRHYHHHHHHHPLVKVAHCLHFNMYYVVLSVYWDALSCCIGFRYQRGLLYHLGHFDMCSKQWKDFKTANKAEVIQWKDRDTADRQ